MTTEILTKPNLDTDGGWNKYIAMQSPRSPLDWESQSVDNDHGTQPTSHEDGPSVLALHELHDQVVALKKTVDVNTSILREHVNRSRGLLQMLFTALDKVLLDIAQTCLQNYAKW